MSESTQIDVIPAHPTWRTVDWPQTMGGNDEEGDCGPCALANLVNIMIQPQIVGRTETERFYTLASGWTSETPGSDKGVVLAELIDDWIANGWPADPTIRPTGRETFRPEDIMVALEKYPACPSAIALTEDQDFSDAAIGRPAAFGHAVLVVSADPWHVTFITWASPQTVSMAWWMDRAREVFGVRLPSPLP